MAPTSLGSGLQNGAGKCCRNVYGRSSSSFGSYLLSITKLLIPITCLLWTSTVGAIDGITMKLEGSLEETANLNVTCSYPTHIGTGQVSYLVWTVNATPILDYTRGQTPPFDKQAGYYNRLDNYDKIDEQEHSFTLMKFDFCDLGTYKCMVFDQNSDLVEHTKEAKDAVQDESFIEIHNNTGPCPEEIDLPAGNQTFICVGKYYIAEPALSLEGAIISDPPEKSETVYHQENCSTEYRWTYVVLLEEEAGQATITCSDENGKEKSVIVNIEEPTPGGTTLLMSSCNGLCIGLVCLGVILVVVIIVVVALMYTRRKQRENAQISGNNQQKVAF